MSLLDMLNSPADLLVVATVGGSVLVVIAVLGFATWRIYHS